MGPNDADEMANSVDPEQTAPRSSLIMANSEDPDQTAPMEQSDQALHCLPRPICPKT